MAVKTRHTATGERYDVELRGQHVKRYTDGKLAQRAWEHGEYLLQLGRPLQDVINELKGVQPEQAPKADVYFERWITLQGCSANSLAVYRKAWLRARVFPKSDPIGGRRLDRITVGTLKEVVKDLTDKGYAPKTVRLSVTILKMMLNEAVDEKVPGVERPPRRLKNNPANEAVRTGRCLSREEWKRLVEAAPEHRRTLIYVWPLLGLRRGEMAGLRWEDLDLTFSMRAHIQRQVDLTGTRGPKGSTATRVKDRWVDLVPEAVEALRAWREVNTESEWVFPSEANTPLTAARLREVVQHAARDAKLTGDLRTHDFRHTFGSWMLEAGASLVYVAARMGHSSPAVTATVYAHEVEERDRRAPGLFAAWIAEDSAEAPAAVAV